jgi:RNA polymerase sigma-70 factor, ECF subfamily
MNRDDVEELAVLWTAAQRVVAAFIRTLIPDPHQSQDILQQVAVVVVRKFSQYDRSRHFTAWAIGIAKQNVLAHRRSRRTDRHIFDDAMVERIALAYERRLPEDLSDVHDALQQCLEKLQDRSYRLIDLYYVRGLKSIEIARRLGLAHGAVRMRLSRTRDALRSCIEARLGRSL